MARNNSASMYQTIEAQRSSDLFYGILFNDTIRNNIFQNTLEILKSAKHNSSKSARLNFALNQIENANSPTLQHTFICFAMVHNENVFHYIINHYKHKKRKDDVQQFIQNNITHKTNQLLNGYFRSIVEYIDDVRSSIAIELGFE